MWMQLKKVITLMKFIWQKHLRFHAAITSPILATVTLGDMTQKEMIVLVSHHPRRPRQLGVTQSRHNIADISAQKSAPV